MLPTKHDRELGKHLKEQMQFYSTLIKPNDLCFDIGGNVGFKTNVFLNLKARVITLEPQQSCVDILEAKYGKRAVILQKGAGEFNEVKEFYVSDNSQLSSFSKDWLIELKKTRFKDSSVKTIEKIEIVTLDSLIGTYGNPGFIKIDVEGYELEVLKGLSKPFGVLSFEYAVPENLNGTIACLKYLKGKYQNLVCNYLICNETNWVLNKWVPVDEMIAKVQQGSFIATYAGDIYIKNENY